MLRTVSKKAISKRDILEKFYTFPAKEEMKIGMEIERLPIDKNWFALDYFGDNNNGVKNILENISDENCWKKIFDCSTLIGLRKDENTITLEPGCQFEISLSPKNSVVELKKEVEKIDSEIKKTFLKYGANLLEYGIAPYSTAKDIKVYPKKRYQYMAKYMPGSLASSMMRETAGIQVAVDFKDEEDAIKKLRIFTKISPVMTAIFANSPIKAGKLSGYKTSRALAWLNTDDNRCGLISKKLFDDGYDFSFKDYIEAVLNVPMIYISRNAIKNNAEIPLRNDILINGKINFNEFLKNGYCENEATLSDYELHQSLFFPEVRLKNYLEIRNHDCQIGDLKYAIPAIYKGLSKDENALDCLIKLFEKFDYDDISNARYDVPKYALDANLGNEKILDYAKEIIKLAKSSLKNDADADFISLIEELTTKGLCPSDIILREKNIKNLKNIKLF